MTELDRKEELHSYVRGARETLVWKLDGLGEYDIRRPMTPTGTSLLGLVKHSTATHVRYFGDVFGRPDSQSLTLVSDDPNAELWATADETRNDIIARYQRSWALADATISDLSLDAIGTVAWWADSEVTLHEVLVHVTAETQRHAGHADIIRELIDGSAGLLEAHSNLRIGDAAARGRFFDQVDEAARLASGH